VSKKLASLQRTAVQVTHSILPSLARRVTTGSEQLRRGIKKLEIRLGGFEKTVSVKPIADIPFPRLDLTACDDPILAITAAPEFAAAAAFFADNPVTSRSLETPTAHALLYCLIRNLRPDHVFEIGTYRAGTTEAICRALCANGNGTAHSVDPFTSDYAEAVLKHWPRELLRHVKLYAANSMTFFTEMRRQKIQPGLVFVDGEHDYEFALSDIGAAACATTPGGYLFIDNIDQAGPYLATRDFLSANPGWREVGSSLRDYKARKAFDPQRNMISDTDFVALQGPRSYLVDERPRTFGLVRQEHNTVNGLRFQSQPLGHSGKLIVQIVLRGFGTAQLFEAALETSIDLQASSEVQSFTAIFVSALQIMDGCVYYTVETWLIWIGDAPLQLKRPPEPF
jgi:predicted O-methyltransferase YrrM